MDQKMFLAVALSMLVMIGFYAAFPPAPPEPKRASQDGAETAPTAEPGQPPVQGQAAPALPAVPSAAVAAAAQRVRVETPRYIAEIDTRGGMLASLKLKDYVVAKAHLDWGDLIPPLRQISFLHSILAKPGAGADAPVEMVRGDFPGSGTLGLRFPDDLPLTGEIDQTVFSADRGEIVLTSQSAPETLVLTGRTPRGLTVRKSITFDPVSYVLHYGASVINYGDSAVPVRIQHLFGEGSRPTAETARAYGHVGPIFRSDGSVETEDAEDMTPQFLVRDVGWLGIGEPYFLTAAAPDSTISHGFYEAIPNPDPKGHPAWIARYGMELPAVTLEPNKQVESAFRLYAGPKQEDDLAKFGDALPEALDITLEALAKPLLAMLRWFNGYTGNYGIAIILLTIVVRVALFPLTYKGMVSMKRMQKLQPRMVAVREKFKNDREKMNREMMAMYKRYKVNPLGGCLPILLQLPIFFALYSALGSAIELRHTEFFGWLTDLSAMDGLFIMPLLMGASMVIQQRLTPTTADPMQAKILAWMPVIFTLFMFTFPSGLTLYWFTSNLLSMAQQVVINRVKVPEPVEQG